MRTGITVTVNAEERLAVDALVENRNTPAKVVWRARIVLATADDCGTNQRNHASGEEDQDLRVALAGALYA
jgi:hypothetical protein